MKKPIDFFCIGSAKSGTTWLFDKLKDHPQLYIPEEKEIHYFNTYVPETLDVENPNLKIGHTYLEEKYSSADQNKLWGDFSTSYLNDEESVERIKNHNKKAKIICIIRQPIERAFSHFLFLQQRGFIKSMSFDKAVEFRPDILNKGIYYQQLKPFYTLFGKENIKILRFEDLSEDPIKALNTIEHFLNVDKLNYENVDKPVNVSKKVRFQGLNNVMIDINSTVKSKIARRLSNKLFVLNTKGYEEDKSLILKALKDKYNAFFREDIEQLSRLIEYDLDKWNDLD